MKKLNVFFIFFLLLVPQVFAVNLDSTKNEYRIKKDEIQATISQKRAEYQEELGNLKGTIAQKRIETREEFKLKLQQIKDEKKRAIVEKINQKIQEKNKKWTDYWLSVLTKLDAILNNISDKTAELKNQGVDTTAVENAVNKAKLAIDAARTAVNNQAAKTYTITIDSEDKLKINVGETVSQFQIDLQQVRKLIVEARQLVWQAANELAKIKK